MNQKGFVNIVLIVLVVALIGALGYVALVKRQAPVEQPEINNSPSAQPSTPTANQIDLSKSEFTPIQAVEKAKVFMVGKVGQKFFDNYYVLAIDRTEKNNRNRMEQIQSGYKFAPPLSVSYFYTGLNQIGGDNQEVRISFAANGNVSDATDIFDCNPPFSCEFKITKEMVIVTAQRAGFNVTSQGFEAFVFPFRKRPTFSKGWTWMVRETISTTSSCLIKELEVNILSGEAFGPFEHSCPGD